MGYKITLNYFKQGNGKWYACGSYETNKEYSFQIVEEVQLLFRARRLPGLREDHSPFLVLIESKEHPTLVRDIVGLQELTEHCFAAGWVNNGATVDGKAISCDKAFTLWREKHL